MNRVKEKELIRDILNIEIREILSNPDVNTYFKMLWQKGNELVNHSLNVAIVSVIIGLNVFESKSKVRDLFVSGLLHDCGKLFLPEKILNKSGKLTRREREEIKKILF